MAGASVKVGSTTVLADSDGNAEFSFAPGKFPIQITGATVDGSYRGVLIVRNEGEHAVEKFHLES